MRTNEVPGYGSWQAMLSRCNNPNSPDYPQYGYRGIEVCERWHTFAYFHADMGEPPPGTTLDRWPDNDAGYWCGHCDQCVRFGRPKNCRWATRAQQTANRGPLAAHRKLDDPIPEEELQAVGLTDPPGPDAPMSVETARELLHRWAASARSRDGLVREAAIAGMGVREIGRITGLAHTTVLRILHPDGT
jgi:hypothetical protein